MKRKEYLNFYWNWLTYQFNPSDQLHITLVLSWVKQFISNDEIALTWSKRDNWTIYYMAIDYFKSKSVERSFK